MEDGYCDLCMGYWDDCMCETCSACRGTGFVRDEECGVCDGDGRVPWGHRVKPCEMMRRGAWCWKPAQYAEMREGEEPLYWCEEHVPDQDRPA